MPACHRTMTPYIYRTYGNKYGKTAQTIGCRLTGLRLAIAIILRNVHQLTDWGELIGRYEYTVNPVVGGT
jgi:hypothetical protein